MFEITTEETVCHYENYAPEDLCIVQGVIFMDTASTLFFPPAPKPRTVPPSLFQMLKVIYKNPIELWGEPSYNEPYVYIRSGIGGPLLVANDPSLIKHVLVDKASNYKMAKIRQFYCAQF